ncbi:FAD-dependent monooxygenase [Streptomyces sp. NPDC002588]|uniref:FAD-dependent monooxygenase n=1 Tax=Streptomyces sp. NPDC002588 TaxID=3154419 RepID=UPI00332BCE3F
MPSSRFTSEPSSSDTVERGFTVETEPVSFVRIVGLHIRSLDMMAMRGLLDRIRQLGRQRPAGGFFAAINKPAPRGLDSAHAHLLGIPQPVIVHLLEEHATQLGAQVRRGCAVADFEQDDEGVTVEPADGEQLRSRYLVGCDGGRSTVRKLLGVGFPGEPSRTETLMGEMEVGVPQEEIAAKVTEIGATGRESRPGVRVTRPGRATVMHRRTVLPQRTGQQLQPGSPHRNNTRQQASNQALIPSPQGGMQGEFSAGRSVSTF